MIANRMPDAVMDPADVAQLGRTQEVFDERARLRDQVATLERHLERESEHKREWRAECLLAEARFRRLIWACCIVIPALVVAALWGRV